MIKTWVQHLQLTEPIDMIFCSMCKCYHQDKDHKQEKLIEWDGSRDLQSPEPQVPMPPPPATVGE